MAEHGEGYQQEESQLRELPQEAVWKIASRLYSRYEEVRNQLRKRHVLQPAHYGAFSSFETPHYRTRDSKYRVQDLGLENELSIIESTPSAADSTINGSVIESYEEIKLNKAKIYYNIGRVIDVGKLPHKRMPVLETQNTPLAEKKIELFIEKMSHLER